MNEKYYLDISKTSDIENKKERFLYRLLETIPGILSLGTLLGVLVFSWLFPAFVAVFIICFCLYYLLRVVYFSLHQIVSYFRIKSHLKKNWLSELKGVKNRRWQNIYHVIILPTYKEDKQIVEETIISLLNSNYPKEKMIVVLAIEKRAGKKAKEMAEIIAKKYSNGFYKFLISIHPDNIPGEIGGKGSNVAWAGKEVKGQIDELKIPYENILVSSFDIDTKVYPQYFTCLAWYYLTTENPLKASYQPIPVYNNNIWSASAFARVVSTSNTFWQMIQQERAEKLTTYSSHSIPGKVFFEVGYPANVVSDDSRIFWRAYLCYDGDYRVVPIYYLVSMDAVMTQSLFRTILNQYRQQKRWAWGCSEIPYIIFGFLKNKKIPLLKKISHLYTIIDGFWSWATAALLLFILGWLPLILGGEKFNLTILSFNLPILTGRIMTMALIGMFISAILSTMLLPPLPKNLSNYAKFQKRISILLQWLLLPATLIIFGAFPALDAQVRLMLGRYIGFWVTEKVRK